jgi:hypothetical protein
VRQSPPGRGVGVELEESPLLEAVEQQCILKTGAKQRLVNLWLTENSAVHTRYL